MKHATSPPFKARSKASGSLYGTMIVSFATDEEMPAEDGTELGASAGPARCSGGFIEIMTSSW